MSHKATMLKSGKVCNYFFFFFIVLRNIQQSINTQSQYLWSSTWENSLKTALVKSRDAVMRNKKKKYLTCYCNVDVSLAPAKTLIASNWPALADWLASNRYIKHFPQRYGPKKNAKGGKTAPKQMRAVWRVPESGQMHVFYCASCSFCCWCCWCVSVELQSGYLTTHNVKMLQIKYRVCWIKSGFRRLRFKTRSGAQK